MLRYHYCNTLNIMNPCSRRFLGWFSFHVAAVHTGNEILCMCWSLRSAEWNESISCWTTKSCWQYASHMGKWETCLLILHSSAPSVCCCLCSNLKRYSTRKSVYSVLWTTGYLEIVEYQACAENVWVYTHKVWLLGVHHHLDSLTMQGKIPFLRKMNSSTINCNNTMSVPCKISAQCDYLSP